MDEVFYLANLPEELPAGLSAAAHYCRSGWRQGIDPSPEFSTSYYLTTNPDIRDSGVNPFWHYLIAGREEGRLPVHPGGWRHSVLSRQTSFKSYCDDWLREDAPGEVLDATELAGRLAASRRCEGLMISVGHDDYRNSPGGVQLCIELEELAARDRDYDYLNLHPWQPLPKLAGAGDDVLLSVILNGETVGVASASELSDAFTEIAAPADTEMVIHHLAGHAPEAIIALAERLEIGRAHFWLHDYFTLCTSYTLQRNNVSPCDAPCVTSNACRICLFGKEREDQLERLSGLFERLDITLVAPSEAALDFWQARTGLRPVDTVVNPHVVLEETSASNTIDVADDDPVRIAFVGTPAPHKGWPIFAELQRRLAAEECYEFWFFGAAPPGSSQVRHVPTHVRASDPESTARQITSHQIELVLHWASWQETFSFSTFEALCGGAYVLTNPGSGNVARAVGQLGRGAIFDDPEALYEFARSDGLKALAQRARVSRRNASFAASFSNMTFDLIGSSLSP